MGALESITVSDVERLNLFECRQDVPCYLSTFGFSAILLQPYKQLPLPCNVALAYQYVALGNREGILHQSLCWRFRGTRIAIDQFSAAELQGP
jgi:hypothetical protein